jgi:brefeldin A-resistance guanine nucleotide exchange factor 1
VNLFVNSLIPTSFKSISRDLDLPPIPLQSPSQVIERNEKSADVGLFSAFTSYVSSVMNDEPPEPNDAEIDATLCTVDYINACHFEQILGNVSELPVESLKTLTLALLAQLPQQDSPPLTTVKPENHAPQGRNGSKGGVEQPVYNPAVVYVLELATILALRDEVTITTLGADVADALQSVVRDAERLHPIALSRTVFYLLSLLRASYDHGFIRAPVVLHAISSFRPDVLRECAQGILKGLFGCISGPAELRHEMASSPDFWAVLQALQPQQADAASLVSQITEAVIADGAITPDNYEAAVILLNNFATAASIGARQEQQRERELQGTSRRGQQQAPASAPLDDDKKPQKSPVLLRGLRAITLVSQLASRVPALVSQSHLEPAAAWRTYWSPVFRCLAKQCVNPCREIRHQSFPVLQRILLSPELATPEHDEWTNIFGEVLFPMVNVLLKPETYQSDPLGMSETRVQAAQLLSRIFLHYLVLRGEGEYDPVLDLWTRILAIMDRFLNSGAGAQGMGVLMEAVPECLKNILLVMSSGGYMVPPPGKTAEDTRAEGQKKLWTQTSERLERFLPGLIADVFPDAEVAVKAPPRGAARAPAASGKNREPAAPANAPAVQPVTTDTKTANGEAAPATKEDDLD